MGALQTFMNLGTVGHSASAGARLPPDASAAFIALGMISGTIGSINFWLLNLVFLLVGLAMYRASQLLAESSVPRSLSRLALAVAILYWLALVTQLFATLAGEAEVLVIYRIVILIGGVMLAPAWSFWVGRELGRSSEQADG